MTRKNRQISCISTSVDTLGLTGLSVTILLDKRIRSIDLKEHFEHCFSFSFQLILGFAFWRNLFFFIFFIFFIIFLITITFTVTLVVGYERSIAVGIGLLPAAMQRGGASLASRPCAASQAFGSGRRRGFLQLVLQLFSPVLHPDVLP